MRLSEELKISLKEVKRYYMEFLVNLKKFYFKIF